ncbi:hypothetical protein [Flavisolibacter tropicus]|uniref:DUF4157 domain-containing protein n=1 Tax=Flavisolibacter tropicus TaxID=1492898 RepID=A0A172U1P4_9BACT|nr:hypothetical protein [Flavisolibacter tropicus]ANE53108.1 hypothetical protein SY85_24185 [Flavisolibacter tropicus]
MFRSLAAIFLFLSSATLIHAQQFGGFPSNTKWKQINTDTARIIYTPGAENEAKRVATIIHKMAAEENTIGGALKKINVVLQSRTTMANGYVALAPYRSEFYLVPGGNIFDFGNLPWQEQLAVHEYRHVQQYNNFNRGGSKVLGVLFGQEGRAVGNGLAIPDWFFEGDAVYMETALTPQGRGRTPYFQNGYKSLWREGRNYNWMKLRNGSLKDYVPNHYQLGYLLVNYGYLKYGADFWKKVTADAASFSSVIYPFQSAIKRHAGVTYATFRKEALDYYSHEVSKRRNDVRNRETVTNYYFAHPISSDSIVYLKDSYKKIPAFYLRTHQGEKRIRLKSIGSEDWFSYRDGLIAYTAFNTDPRWSLVDYNDVVLLDMQTGQETWLTHKGKYYTPDISPNTQTIIATAVTDSVTSELQLINRKGVVSKSIHAPQASFFFHPKFIDDEHVVVGVRWPDATMSLEVLELSTQKMEALIPRTLATIGYPFVNNNSIYFTSSLAGTDNIYVVRLEDKKIFQLTNSQTGLYFPAVANDSLFYSAFTSNGLALKNEGLSSVKTQEIASTAWSNVTIPYTVAGDANRNILQVPTREFPERPYRKATGLLNFHSWRPDYADPEFSFSVYSDNILNTFSSELFYKYNENENSHAVGFNAIYGGWFPQVVFGVERINNRHLKSSTKSYILNQTESNVGYAIPFNFSKGKTLKSLSLGSRIYYTTLESAGKSPTNFAGFQSTYLSHAIGWVQQLPRARQQIYPKWGYALAANYRHRLDEKGYQAIGSSSLYLPGLFPNHSLVVQGSIQETDTSNVIFSNRFANSRGYSDYYFSRMWKVGANYHLPLLYPDKGFGNIVYLQRIRGNAFYDFTRVYSNTKTATRDLRSVGSELFFDTRWWNSYPLTLGVRYSYLLDANVVGAQNPNHFEIVLPLNLIPD